MENIDKILIDAIDKNNALSEYNLAYTQYLRNMDNYGDTYIQNHIRPSGIAYCLRKQYLGIKNNANTMVNLEPEFRSTLDNGTLAHERIQKSLRESGILIEFIECDCGFKKIGHFKDYCEIPEDYIYSINNNIRDLSKCPECGEKLNYKEIRVKSDEDMVSMKIDGLLNLNNEYYILEIKTIYEDPNSNNRGFSKIKYNNSPEESHILQSCMYLYFITRNLKDINKLLDKKFKRIKKISSIIWHYESKNTNKYISFKYRPSKEMMLNCLKKYKMIKKAIEEDKDIPPKEKSKLNSYECKRCPFLKDCKKYYRGKK